MTDEELAGQLFMISYPGTSPDQETMNWIRNRNLGGIKIFGRNFSTIPELAKDIGKMQKASQQTKLRIPLLVATDQEGGWVRHIKGETSITSGNMALGASQNHYDTWLSAFYINRELRMMGINMNFAPTVDLYFNNDNIVIGPRSFGSDPHQAAELAMTWYQGAKETGIITTAKHFPGHGRTDKDSHGTLPVIKASYSELEKTDLVPFKKLIDAGVPAIMAGHLSFPSITGNSKPATISSTLLKNILRKHMNFDGIIITDDMVMGGATKYASSVSKACFEAIRNGVDIVLVSKTPETFDNAHRLVVNEMKRNGEFRKQVIDSVTRILKVKLAYLKPLGQNALYPDGNSIVKFFPDKEAEEFFYEQNVRSVSFIRKADTNSIALNGRKMLLVGHSTFIAEGLKRFPKAGFYRISSNFFTTDGFDPNILSSIIPKYDKVVFCVGSPAQAKILSYFKRFRNKIVVFSLLTPAFLDDVPWASGIAVYGNGNQSIEAGMAAMAGDYVPQGKLPIILKGE